MDGLPRDPREQRMSTRFTRKVSKASSICARFNDRPRPPSRPHLMQPKPRASLHRLLISPPCRRQSEFALERLANRLLGLVADRMCRLGNGFLGLPQV